MRARLVILLSLVPVMTALTPLPAHAGRAAGGALVLAQTQGGDLSGQDNTAKGQEGQQGSSGKGQGAAGAQTGAGGQTEGGASATGPPWTYQMARLSVLLLILLALSIGLNYRRLVTKRQRGEV